MTLAPRPEYHNDSTRRAPCPPRPFVGELLAHCIKSSHAGATFVCRSCWDAMLDGKARREEWRV